MKKPDKALRRRLTAAGVWLSRLLVGGTFTFSGLTKSIDPWGTYYKVDSYFAAMHIETGDGTALFCAFALSALELLTGVMVLLGCYRRVAAWAASAIMAMMLPLTLWIAVADPVADCGCFGDALVISNWATFWKNVVLGAACVWLVIYGRRVMTLVNPYLQWIGVVATLAFNIAVQTVGYNVQPVIDFRPFPDGTHLFESGDAGDDEGDYVFVYAKGDERREFGIDDTLPDEESGWHFVERRSLEPSVRIVRSQPESKSLRLWSEDGNEDVTESAAPADGEGLLVVIPDITRLSMSSSWRLNELYDLAIARDVEMAAVAAATPARIATWRDLSLAEYPIYTAEDTELKELVRGNPGVVYLRDGEIVWKTTLSSLDTDCLERGEEVEACPVSNLARPRSAVWRRIYGYYLLVMGLLVAATLTESGVTEFRRRKHRKKKKN